MAARTTAETATNRCGGAEKLDPALIDRNPEPRCAAKWTLGSAPCRERDHRPARASPDAHPRASGIGMVRLFRGVRWLLRARLRAANRLHCSHTPRSRATAPKECWPVSAT